MPEEKAALREQAEVDQNPKVQERRGEEAGSGRQHWAREGEESEGVTEKERRVVQ